MTRDQHSRFDLIPDSPELKQMATWNHEIKYYLKIYKVIDLSYKLLRKLTILTIFGNFGLSLTHTENISVKLAVHGSLLICSVVQANTTLCCKYQLNDVRNRIEAIFNRDNYYRNREMHALSNEDLISYIVFIID